MFQKKMMGHEAPEQHMVMEIHHPIGHASAMQDQKRDKGMRSPYMNQLPQGSTPDQPQDQTMDMGMGGSY